MAGKSVQVIIPDNSKESEEYEVRKNDEDLVYHCKSCDFSTKSKQGVSLHISRMHKKKPQDTDKSLDLGKIEEELLEDLHISGEEDDLQTDEFIFQPPITQADFNLNVTNLFESHEREVNQQDDGKNKEASPIQSTPVTISWRSKYEEK